MNILEHLKSLINEAWFKNVNGKVDVFKNPDFMDIKDIRKNRRGYSKGKDSFRFLINKKTGEVYLWDGWLAEHATVMRDLGLSDKDYLRGEFGYTNPHGILDLTDYEKTFTDPKSFERLYKRTKLPSLFKRTNVSNLVDLSDLKIDSVTRYSPIGVFPITSNDPYYHPKYKNFNKYFVKRVVYGNKQARELFKKEMRQL